MIGALVAGCNTPSENPKESDSGPKGNEESKNGGEQVSDGYIRFYADMTGDDINETIVVDPAAAVDTFSEQKTIWVIDGLTDEELWSTTFGMGSPRKGGVYLKFDYSSTGNNANIYFWETFISEELGAKMLYILGYEVFSKNEDYEIVVADKYISSYEKEFAIIDISNEITIVGGMNKFQEGLSYIAQNFGMGDVIALIDTSRNELIYSTPEVRETSDDLRFELEKGLVYSYKRSNK